MSPIDAIDTLVQSDWSTPANRLNDRITYAVYLSMRIGQFNLGISSNIE